MAKLPTMINAGALAAEPVRTDFIGIVFEDHVTEQHARTIIEMVGGELVGARTRNETSGGGIVHAIQYAAITVQGDQKAVIERLLSDPNVDYAVEINEAGLVVFQS